MTFRDREEAGRILAQGLATLAPKHPVVIALPRGGVPVAFEVARALGAPMDVLAVRKLGAPMNPEYGVGAVVEDGTAVLDEWAAAAAGISRAGLAEIVEREAAELMRRVERYRGGRPMMSVAGRTVVVVDDGIATGVTDLAAIRALRKRNPRRIVLAVPVAPADSLAAVAKEADEVVCPLTPRPFGGVGVWYADFSQVSDAEVVDLLARSGGRVHAGGRREVAFELDGSRLMATLMMPPEPRGLVVFAHGSGSSRHSPRNLQVAQTLADAGYATLLMDLLTEAESSDRSKVFDTPLLGDRLVAATRWARVQPGLRDLPTGYFGASTGAAAALRAAASLGGLVGAIVSRGGRPDLAGDALEQVSAPTLLIVGGDDHQVLALNAGAARRLGCPHELSVVPGSGHLFEEAGALEAVARLAVGWFDTHLATRAAALEPAA